MAVNPKYYEQMSELLDALIEQRRQEPLDYQAYLERIVELTRQVKEPESQTSYPAAIPPLLAKWEPTVGKPVSEVRIKRMRTRWGSCNAEARRIWLNLELIKKPVACLECVLLHELVHLRERHHNERFQEWMGMLMPTWSVHRDELNRAPLAHEEWTY